MEPMIHFLTARKLIMYRRVGMSLEDDQDFQLTPHRTLTVIKAQSHAKNALLPAHLVHQINIYQLVRTGEEGLFLLYYGLPGTSLGKSDIRKIQARKACTNGPCTTYLLMYMSTQAMVIAHEFGYEVSCPEVFLFYRSKSRLVGRYTIVGDHVALLHRLNCTIDSLPVMLADDMMVRYYGWKVGEIVYCLENDTYRVIKPA